MMVSALIWVCAGSLAANVFLASFCTRTMHWANYWKKQYKDATAPIDPVLYDPWDDVKEAAGYEEVDW